MSNIELCIKELGYAEAPITGTSMLPLLREGRDLAELEAADPKKLKKGDVVLYRKADGTLVLHRIINTENGKFFTVLGDHQFKNADRVNKDQIIAVARGFFIKGRFVDEKSRRYRLYKRIWIGSLTIRRILLAVLRLLGIGSFAKVGV